ncbi:MAG: acetyl-CoA carboxylase biotin carboxyl carrier protein [Candidatus Omnitrophota bacterium]|jgi:acetyl-CoA carboxylase biotin carboxyl carrier protein
MDFRDLKRIIELMKINELSELDVEDQGFRVSARRGSGAEPTYMVSTQPAAPMVQSPAFTHQSSPQAGAPPVEAVSDGQETIVSPMVGTFYRASSPDVEVFVKVGDTVDEDSVVCVIEAMKVMNEIKAETSGVIRQILVGNAEAVEYNQPLFKVEPA